jgi:hypothetical protein
MHLSHFGMSLKIFCSSNLFLVFATIHEQPFHYCGIGDLPSVASGAQTSGSLVGQGQDYRVDSP